MEQLIRSSVEDLPERTANAYAQESESRARKFACTSPFGRSRFLLGLFPACYSGVAGNGSHSLVDPRSTRRPGRVATGTTGHVCRCRLVRTRTDETAPAYMGARQNRTKKTHDSTSAPFIGSTTRTHGGCPDLRLEAAEGVRLKSEAPDEARSEATDEGPAHCREPSNVSSRRCS